MVLLQHEGKLKLNSFFIKIKVFVFVIKRGVIQRGIKNNLNRFTKQRIEIVLKNEYTRSGKGIQNELRKY